MIRKTLFWVRNTVALVMLAVLVWAGATNTSVLFLEVTGLEWSVMDEYRDLVFIELANEHGENEARIMLALSERGYWYAAVAVAEAEYNAKMKIWAKYIVIPSAFITLLAGVWIFALIGFRYRQKFPTVQTTREEP